MYNNPKLEVVMPQHAQAEVGISLLEFVLGLITTEYDLTRIILRRRIKMAANSKQRFAMEVCSTKQSPNLHLASITLKSPHREPQMVYTGWEEVKVLCFFLSQF